MGSIAGANFVDWPIGYDDLEPYYTKVDWEMGVSGVPGPFDARRSRPYPMPPLPVKSSGVLMDRGAAKLGWHSQPAPMAINSQFYNGRPACQHCGFCLFFMCEFRSKSTSMATMLPVAEATGRCEIRPNSYVARVETNSAGRATGVTYFDASKELHLQRAKAVVLCANGGETPRLLLNSSSPRFPNGLANSSGVVGQHLMFNTYSGVNAQFTEVLNEHKSVQNTRILLDFYESEQARGFYGGGGIDARFGKYPITFALGGLPPGSPTWGEGFARARAAVHPCDVLRYARHIAAGAVEQHLARSIAEGRLGASGHARHLHGSSGRPEEPVVPHWQGYATGRGRRSHEGLARPGCAANKLGAPAGHVPDGKRSEDVGRGQVQPDT